MAENVPFRRCGGRPHRLRPTTNLVLTECSEECGLGGVPASRYIARWGCVAAQLKHEASLSD